MARVEGLSADRLTNEAYWVLKTIQLVRSCRMADIQRAFDDLNLGLPQHDVGEMRRLTYFECTDAGQTVFQLTAAGEAAIERHERENPSTQIEDHQDSAQVPASRPIPLNASENAHAPLSPDVAPPPHIPPARQGAQPGAQRQPTRTTDQRRTSGAQPAGPGPQQQSGRGGNKPLAAHGSVPSARPASKTPAAAAKGKTGKPKPR